MLLGPTRDLGKYLLKTDSWCSVSSSSTMVYSLAFFNDSIAFWLFSSSTWPPGGKFGKMVVGNKSSAFLENNALFKITIHIKLARIISYQLILPIIKEKIFYVGHIHRIKFINTENFEEFFNGSHTITTS